MVRQQTVRPQSGNKDTVAGKYHKERNKSSVGRFMRTFSYSKLRERMTQWSDKDYLVILFKSIDSDACAYMADAFIEAWSQGMKTGNMKEVTASQQTAFDNSVDYMFEVLGELSPQNTMKKLLSNPTFQDTVTDVTSPTIACYEPATLADLYQLLEGTTWPDAVVQVWKKLNFYFKLQTGYQVAEIAIPDRYVMPFMPYKASDDVKTLCLSIRANQGEMEMHCKKFGIKTTKFSQDWFEAREITINDLDAISYFQHAGLNFRNSADTADRDYWPSNPLHEDGSESKKWWFKTDPNESALNYLAPVFYPYQAQYNMYGGLLSLSHFSNTQNVWAVKCKYTDTTFTNTTFQQQIELAMCFLAMWEQTNTLNIELTGTEVTNNDINYSNNGISWPYATERELVYGTGINEDSKDQTLIAYLISLMF
jgi:hypothetical protein